MATKKKKVNYISYELKKLQAYIDQLQSFMDSNPPDSLQDRLDVRYSTQGNPIVKVIASKESQLKTFRDTLEKLPALYESLNNLKRLANSDPEEDEVVETARGGIGLPGIFKSRMLGPNAAPEEEEEPDSEDDGFEWEDQ